VVPPEHPAQPTEIPPEKKSSIAAPLLTALLLVFTFLTFPITPTDNYADTSLSAVLQYAQQHHTQFGTELIYTYGPLGFLIFPHYAQHTTPLRMAVDVMVCLFVAVGVCLLAWRVGIVWRLLLLLLYAWAASNIYPATDFVLETGLFSWGFLCFFEAGDRLSYSGLLFAAFAAFCALAKVSLLFVGTAAVVLTALDAGVRDRRAALAIVGGFIGLFTAGWLLAGQHLANVGPFVINSLAVIKGYNAALGNVGLEAVTSAGIVVALLLAPVVILRSAASFGRRQPIVLLRRVFFLGFLSLIAFTSWKHGFVRADAHHVVLFLGLVPVLVLALESVRGDNPILNWSARLPGLLACLLSVVTLQTFYFSVLPVSLLQPIRSLRTSLQRVLHPGSSWSELDTALDTLEAKCQLPECRRIIGQEPVDVFGQRQDYALFNDLNFRLRPVYQSYAACSARLMHFNEEQFFSESAAPYVLFELRALDWKFPVLEDAWFLRDLLVNSELVTREGDFLLLKRTSSISPRMTLVAEGAVRPGEHIDLARYGNMDLWLEIDLRPTFAGRVRQLLYRPSTIRLAAWGESGKLLYRHQAAASMLSAGFIASPLLLRTDDVLDLFQTNALPRPQAYSVELAEHDPFWQQSIQFRLYRIENRLTRAPLSGPTVEPGQPAPGLGPPGGRGTAAGGVAFSVFRDPRWRGEDPPGTLQDLADYSVFLLFPAAVGWALVVFARRQKKMKRPARWPLLILGNALVFVFLASLLLLGAETYFRFFYDTTDSLGYTRVCQKWVQRHWHVNKAGCRDDVEYSPKLQPGKRRISFLGDSFTAGHGIKDVEDRFPNRLRRAHPDTEIHVLANVGLDTGAEIVLLQRLISRSYQFDQVVLVYCLNDIADLLSEQSTAYDQLVAGFGRSSWLTRNSYAANLLYHRYRASKNPYARNYCSYVRDAYRGAVWEEQKKRLQELRDLVESHGGRFAVVTFPFLDALGPNYPYTFVHQELDKFWADLHVPHLDLLPVYKDLPSGALVVNPYDAHPNERACRLAAEAIEKGLIETGKLKTGNQGWGDRTSDGSPADKVRERAQ